MDEHQAASVAASLGGETWQSGGDVWLALFRREDDKVVCLSDEAVAVYATNVVLKEAAPQESISLY